MTVLQENYEKQYQALQACEANFLQEMEEQFEMMFESLQATRSALLE